MTTGRINQVTILTAGTLQREPAEPQQPQGPPMGNVVYLERLPPRVDMVSHATRGIRVNNPGAGTPGRGPAFHLPRLNTFGHRPQQNPITHFSTKRCGLQYGSPRRGLNRSNHSRKTGCYPAGTPKLLERNHDQQSIIHSLHQRR